MASCHDNLAKSVSEYQTILDFAAARNDGGGAGDNWNSQDMQSSSQLFTTKKGSRRQIKQYQYYTKHCVARWQVMELNL